MPHLSLGRFRPGSKRPGPSSGDTSSGRPLVKAPTGGLGRLDQDTHQLGCHIDIEQFSERSLIAARADGKCRSCRKGRYEPPVRMVKLTERYEITPYKWVHPDEEK
jgi:hypothetical protein